MPKKPNQNKKSRTQLRNAKIQQFLPCFFDVPAADVQDILQVSHHTLDPARRSLGLQKWPFVDVTRNKFCMSSSEISSLRAQMMSVADEEMRDILTQMAQRAQECQRALESKKKHTVVKTVRPVLQCLRSQELEQLIETNMQLVQSRAAPPMDDAQLQSLIDDACITSDSAFWNEVSEILFS